MTLGVTAMPSVAYPLSLTSIHVAVSRHVLWEVL
jgi:hypothetical protein